MFVVTDRDLDAGKTGPARGGSALTVAALASATRPGGLHAVLTGAPEVGRARASFEGSPSGTRTSG